MKTALIIHGYNVNAGDCFYPWLMSQLEKHGYNVEVPSLPNTSKPNIDKQVNYILKNYPDKKNIIIGHSFGAAVAMKLVEELDYNIDALYLVSGFIDTNFDEGDEAIEVLSKASNWQFNFNDINKKSNVYILRPTLDTEVNMQQTINMASKFNKPINFFKQKEDHACGSSEPAILKFILNEHN